MSEQFENIEAHSRLINEKKASRTVYNDADDIEITPRKKSSWPKTIEDAAFYGLAGEIVRSIEPHTESDPVALLIQFLVVFGNVIDRTAYFPIEAAKHHLNLFVVLVGVSSKGRKGTAWQYILRLFERVDEDWKRDRLKSGLSSGEGLIWAVRDPIQKSEANKEKEGEFKTVTVDPGVSDKRLCDIETEFSSVLKNFQRDGNKLSAVLRDAWDGVTLSSLTKGEPAKASDPHISIIGHITKPELLRYLNETETANGFANRFLWFAVKRSKRLPFGGSLSEESLHPLLRRLQDAIGFAERVGALGFDSEAKSDWIQLYDALSDEKPGLLGAMLARAEPQILRLASIYALLDFKAEIGRPHLEAAIAVWQYCEDSCRFIFGDSTGNAPADKILDALKSKPDGMTQTDIQSIFNRNLSAAKLRCAMEFLFERELIRSEDDTATGGRSARRWFAVAINEPTKHELNEKSPPSEMVRRVNSLNSSFVPS